LSGAPARASPPASAPPPPAAPTPLFRGEVIAARQDQWLGVVLLEPGPAGRVLTLLGIFAIAALTGLLAFGSYTRKMHVAGWLVPDAGLIAIHASQAGSVARIHVREGQKVVMGEPLITLSGEVRDEGGIAVKGRVVDALIGRRDSQKAEGGFQSRLFDEEDKVTRDRVASLDAQSGHLRMEVDLQKRRLQLAERTLDRMRKMRALDLIPSPRLEQAEQDRLDQGAKLHALERTEATVAQDLITARSAVRGLPLRRDTQLATIDRSVATINQELAEAEGRRGLTITAPSDGIVSGLQIEVGSDIAASSPLLNILPDNSRLQAQLFATSRSVGFLHAGQQVLLRYQAYPYQKFGAQAGVVLEITQTAVSPTELNRKLTGLSGLYGANEPVYRITVDLGTQNILAYGESMPLRPGMQVDADVMVDRRRLFEWMLDPLYSLTGR
jgi:membrane fusion protein